MSSQTLSNVQMDQLRQMLLEHGSEAVFFGLGEIAKQKRLEEEGQPEEGKYAKQTKKKTKTQIRKNKKMLREAKAEELASKIKTNHDIDVNPTEFTLTALNKILRTGEMQEKRKKKGTNGYMRFLTQERVENKKRAEPIPSNELVKLVGQKWRDMTDEQKAVWNTAEPTAEKQVEEPTVEKQVEEPTVEKQVEEPTAEKQVDEPTAEKQVEEPTAEKQVEEPTVEKQVEEPTAEKQVEEPNKATQAPKMKKKELKIYLTERHGWEAKLLSKFSVIELRQAKDTGKLPFDAMKMRRYLSLKKGEGFSILPISSPEYPKKSKDKKSKVQVTKTVADSSMFNISEAEEEDESN